MPGRRRRKRKYPQHVGCDSPTKRREFLLHSSRQHSHQTNEQSQLALADEEATEETAPYVSLYEHLSLSLPADLVCSLPMSKTQPLSSYNSIPLYDSTSLLMYDTPSFCISRFSIALMNGADLKTLLFEVSTVGRNIRTSILYSTDDWGNYIALSCGQNDSVYLPIITKPLLHIHKNTFSSRWYKVRLVLCETTKESGREIQNNGSCQGEEGEISKSGADVEMREEGSSTSERESGAEPILDASSRDGEAQTVCEEVDCMEEGSARSGESQVGGAGGGEQGYGVFGRDRCVEVEVWVGGVMCEPSDPNALPLGGNSTSLGRVMKTFHPDISDEAMSNSRRCKYNTHHLAAVVLCWFVQVVTYL